ncbi:hypothetical protein FACS1894181_00860 [Bacteroidia bacterium]|nr:hypothetical protein FACS1894181_00860 [Bacteroidia bacterium]
MNRKLILAVAVCAGLVIPAILLSTDVVKETTGKVRTGEESLSIAPDTLPKPATVIHPPTPATSPGTVALDSLLAERRRASRPELKARQPTPPAATSIHIGRAHEAFTPEELVKGVFLYSDGGTPCEIDGLISDVSFTGTGWDGIAWGAARGLSYFDNGLIEFQDVVDGEEVEMADGILLATGNGLNMEGANTSPAAMSDGTASLTGDPDLTPLITPYPVQTGAILEFNFIPQQDHISFEYSFASEEYPEYANTQFNDIFGFFIWEVDPVTKALIGDKSNIARLPNTNTNDFDVKINNVNWGYRIGNTADNFADPNAVYEGTLADYPNGSGGAMAFNPLYHKAIYQNSPSMEFDGRTVILTAGYDVIPGHMYHLKLAVANASDNSLGSGVFLKAGSLKIGTGVTNWGNRISGMDHVYESCTDNFLTVFTALDGATRNLTLEYTGTAVGSIVQPDGTPMPTNRVVPANQNIDTIFYRVIDGATEGYINVKAYVPGCIGDPLETTIYVHPSFTDVELVVLPDCGGADLGAIAVSVTGGHAPQMSMDNGATWQSVYVPFTGLAEGTSYDIRVRDSIGCIYDTVMHAVIPPCYQVVPENATVQEYQEIIINVLANDVLPATIFTPTFNLMDAVSAGGLPKAGTLTSAGVGANSRFVYRNNGTSTLTNNINIDSFKYQFNVTYPVPQTLSATVYIYILQDQNGATACMNSPYTINLAPKPAGVQFYWTAMGGVESPTPSPTRLIANVTDTVSFLVRPVVPTPALYNGLPFPAGKFTVWVGDKAGMGEMRWAGHFNHDWRNPSNWEQRRGDVYTPVQWSPSECVDVVIPANVDSFPELASPVFCRDILMKDRSMLKNPHELVYRNASVEIKLKPAELDRFVMWSAPLKEMYSGDYYYNTYNKTGASQGDVFMNLFYGNNPDYPGSAAAKNYFTATFGSENQKLELGRGFNLKAAHTTVTLDSALRFPRPLDNTYAGGPRPDKNKFITHGVTLGTDKRFDMKAYGGDASFRLVQVVNPYMAYLNIDSFLKANTNFQEGYYIWNGNPGNGFSAAALTGDANRILVNNDLSMWSPITASNLLIAPLQSFFVAKKETALSVNIQTVKMSPNWTTTSPVASYALRSAGNSAGILNIKLSQGKNEACAAMVYDPSATNFIDKNDLPVLVYDELPLTLYTFSVTNVPLVINNSGMFDMGETPLGLRVKDAGDVKLEFINLRTFGYDVVLIDKQLNKEIDLNTTSEYTFPVTKPSASALEINSRFSLRMKYTGKGIGGLTDAETISSSALQVTGGDGYISIQAGGSVSNLQVYNTLGLLVHSLPEVNESSYRIPVSGKQIYIVKVQTGNLTKTEKVYVQ